MAYEAWSSTKTTILLRNSYWNIKTTWKCRKDPIANKTQVQVLTFSITSLKSTNKSVNTKVVYNICTTGAPDADYNNRTTVNSKTILGGTNTTTFTLSNVIAAIPHSASGVRENPAYFHWWLTFSNTPANFPSFTQGSHKTYDFKSQLPKIDRTSEKGSISVSVSYNTATVTYTSKEYGKIYFKEPSSDSYTLEKEILSGSKVVTKTYTNLEPGRAYVFGAYNTRSYNNVDSAKSTVTKNMLTVPNATIPTIRAINIGYFNFNIVLDQISGVLYDKTTLLDNESGRLTIKIVGDTSADGDEVEYTINQLRNGIGYGYTQEQHDIKPNTQYQITISSYAPITNKVVSRTTTVKTKNVEKAVLSDLRIENIKPYSFVIKGADTDTSIYYDLTSEIEGRYGYLELAIADNGIYGEPKEISIAQLKKGIVVDNLQPENTYTVKVTSETPITHETTEKIINNIKTSTIENVIFYKGDDGWKLGYLYIKTDNGWKECIPYIGKNGEWVKGSA